MLRCAPFGALVLGALVALFALSGCSGVVSPEPTAAADEALTDDVRPLGLVQDEEQPQSEEARRRVVEERKRVLMQKYVADAGELMKSGNLDRAETLLLEALRTDPRHPEANMLLKQVQERLGKRPGEVESLAERERQKHLIRMERALTQVEEALKIGDKSLEGRDYDAAVRSYEQAFDILNFQPLIGEKDPNLKARAVNGLKTARAAQREHRKEVQESTAREAYEKLRFEEQKERERREARLKKMIDKAQLRFEEDRFDEALHLIDQVLEEEPTDLEASKLQEEVFDARHNFRDKEYVEQRKERYQRWRESVEAAKIPESDILKWPSQSYWDKITRERKAYSPTYGTEDSLAVKKIKNKLQTETIPLEFEEANLKDVLDWIKSVANIPIVYDSEIVEELQSAELGFPLKLEKVKVGVALDTVISAKPEFGYTFKHDVIYITKKEKAAGTPMPVVHDVRDLTIPVQDFTPPEIELKAAGFDDEGGRLFGTPAEEAPPSYNPEDLIELIKENIATTSWEEMEGVTIDLSAGRLLVIHTPETQNKIREFLDNLRSFTTAIVTVEARFITVQDHFLEDIGVDWRGLGGAGQKGTAATLDDVTNGADDMASVGLDNAGTGLPVSNIASPFAGAFFNDGEDGDIRARTENITDNLIGSILSPTGGLSLAWSWLGDTEVNAILRAVEKTERATLLTAPRLTVYNTQRSNITLVNQISYIKDYDVEVAQTASIADPVVGIIQDGLVLDVRPTISNDRRFVTLELRPTVANLIEPIRTITTTLGSQTQPVTIQLPELIVQSAETTVTVPDRGTVVIGGLKNVLSQDKRAEIPILADIPILGFFFSRKSRAEEAKDLIMLVTVHISDLQEQEETLRR